MVRRRRRAKYTWMPTLGGEFTQGESLHYRTTYFSSSIEVDAAALGPSDLYVTPIVPDYTQTVTGQGGNTDTSLRDFTEGQDWLLKRIVGKIIVTVGQEENATPQAAPRVFTIGAGFFVQKADTANPALPDVLEQAEIDPLGLDNVRNPWAWRRTWTLMNGLQAGPTTQGADDILATNNAELTGATGGPCIDSKVARRIRRDERLWFVINAYGSDNLAGETPSSYANFGVVQFQLDYRILGAMRRSNNKSTFG